MKSQHWPCLRWFAVSHIASDFGEKLKRGVSKLRGFPNRGGFPLFFRERSRLCRSFRDYSSPILLKAQERGQGQIGKIPGQSPDKSGRSRKRKKWHQIWVFEPEQQKMLPLNRPKYPLWRDVLGDLRATFILHKKSILVLNWRFFCFQGWKLPQGLTTILT